MEFKHDALQNYKDLGKIGEGGQGTVYKVQEASRRRVYALKILNEKSDPELFKKEIEALERINHKNIVRMHDFSLGNNEQEAFILMDYMKHGNILEYLKKNRAISLRDKLLFIQDIGEALQCIHKQEFSHRDVKPHNIFITEDTEGNSYACLGDFGVVKNVGKEATETSGGKGTELYLPLGVLRGDKIYSQEDDIYGLGMSMYQILTGEHPYGNVVDYVQKITSNKIIRKPSQYDSLVNEDIDRICLRSIAAKPEDRYSHVDLFLEDLNSSINKYSSSPVSFSLQGNGQRRGGDQTEERSQQRKVLEQDILEKETEHTNGKKCSRMNILQRLREKMLLRRAEMDQSTWAMLRLARLYLRTNDREKLDKALSYYETAAERGNCIAAIEVAELYLHGRRGVHKDNEKAEKYYQIAIEHNSIEAARKLGDLYFEPLYGFRKNYDKALTNYNKALHYYETVISAGDRQRAGFGNVFKNIMLGRKEDASFLYKIGVIYKKGLLDQDPDYEKAKEYYEKAIAEKGCVQSRLELAKLYTREFGCYQQGRKAFELYKEVLKKSNGYAEYKIGELFAQGEIYEKVNFVSASYWFHESIKKGEIKSLSALGKLYEIGGYGIGKSNEEAERYYRKGVMKGDEKSLNCLVHLYKRGYQQGVNIIENLKQELEKEIDKGNEAAIFSLGLLYKKDKQFKEAKQYLTKAIDGGMYRALVVLGDLYKENGKGIEAVKNYERALEYGYDDACGKIGKYYEIGGGGIDRDYDKAIEYYTLGALAGDKWAIIGLGHIYRRVDYSKKDYHKAATYYFQGLKRKDSMDLALVFLKQMYDDGYRGAIFGKSIKWLESQEAKKDVWATLQLGYLYEKGNELLIKDCWKAYEYYKKAMSYGEPYGTYRVGLLFEEGEISAGKGNTVQAKKYYEKAIAGGCFDAYYNLGNFYMLGKGGVEKNFEKARECYEKASLRGYQFIQAGKKLKELEKNQGK